MYNFLNNLFVQYVHEACGLDKSYPKLKFKKIGEFHNNTCIWYGTKPSM